MTPRTACLVALLVSVCSFAVPRAFAAPAPDPRVLEFGWTAEGYIDPTSESQGVQIALDQAQMPVAVWAGRATINDPFRLVWSTLSGTAWSATAPVFAPGTAAQLLPRVSRAPDGTIWLAWLENQINGGIPQADATIMAARYADGAWSSPEVVAPAMAKPDSKALEYEYSVMAVDRDSVWVAFARNPSGDPLAPDRDLYAVVRSASGWSSDMLIAAGGPPEARPALAPSVGNAPVVFYAYSSAPSVLLAQHYTAAGWSDPPQTLNAPAFFGHAAAPDTNGAVRVVTIVRDALGDGYEDHIREIIWNPEGVFAESLVIATLPYLQGGINDPPDWSNLTIARNGECSVCASGFAAPAPRFRVAWVDATPSGASLVLSVTRTLAGYSTYDSPGTTYERSQAFPVLAHDGNQDRWYAVWNAPPGTGARLRSKFAWTQEFAGDVGIGGTYIAPDTVRVTTVCSGDASGRTFRLYRLDWPASQGTAPFAPPIPAAAVPLDANPFSGPCDFVTDDFPGEGRWFYYVELEAQGTFPARYARSFSAAIVPGGGGGGPGDVTRTELLPPFPNPSAGSAVLMPMTLLTGGHVRIAIQDLRGRLVRTIDLGSLPAGRYEGGNAPQWNRTDDNGSSVRGGVYFATLSVDGATAGDGRRVVLVGPANLRYPVD